MKPLTFLIADDTAMYRQILRKAVQAHPSWAVVGEAENGVEALKLVAEHTPDVVFMDVNMPLMNGIVATQRIKRLAPATHVLVFSGYDDEEFQRESLLAGADYFVRKEDLDADKLLSLITALFPTIEQ